MTGVGGGSLMAPLLVLAMGVAPAVAVGTDLLFAALTKAVGALVHARRGLVHWRVRGWLALGSVPSAFAMLHVLAHFAPRAAALDRLVTHTLGVALILTAAALLVLDRLRARRRPGQAAGPGGSCGPSASAPCSVLSSPSPR